MTPGKSISSGYPVPVTQTSQPTIQVAAAIARAARPRFLPLDVLVKTPREVAERARAEGFFIQRILREGRVLYER